MSGTSFGSSVSTTLQLGPRPRGTRWPRASSAKGPTAARITSSSPWTSAMDPPVSGVTVWRRARVSCRIWSRLRSPAAAVAMSMIRAEVATDRLSAMVSGPGSARFVTRGSYIAVRCAPRERVSTSGSRSEIEGATPVERANRDQNAGCGDNEDRRGGDRAIDRSRLEFGVHRERKRLGSALEIAGEHDRRAEFPEGSGPAHHETGGERRGREGKADEADDLAFRGSIHSGGVLEVAVDAGDPRSGRPNVERGGDEDLGEHHSGGRERDVEAGVRRRFADETAP